MRELKLQLPEVSSVSEFGELAKQEPPTSHTQNASHFSHQLHLPTLISTSHRLCASCVDCIPDTSSTEAGCTIWLSQSSEECPENQVQHHRHPPHQPASFHLEEKHSACECVCQSCSDTFWEEMCESVVLQCEYKNRAEKLQDAFVQGP